MADTPRQPWTKGAPDEPLTSAAMDRIAARMEELAMAREQRFKLFLALVPLLWGGISFLLWLAYFAVTADPY